jgi:hypothetical protein
MGCINESIFETHNGSEQRFFETKPPLLSVVSLYTTIADDNDDDNSRHRRLLASHRRRGSHKSRQFLAMALT